MPIEVSYNLKCDICPNARVDGPWDVAIDYISLATLPRIQLDDWVIVDYNVVCPKHKVKVFKGYAHNKKGLKNTLKEVTRPGFIMTEACRDNKHALCEGPNCMCPCHMKTTPRDSL